MRRVPPSAGSRTDGQIEMDVVHALDASQALKDDMITAATIQSEVTLSGTVSSDSSKQLAESIAKTVPGVTKVHNNLKVGNPADDANAQVLRRTIPATIWRMRRELRLRLRARRTMVSTRGRRRMHQALTRLLRRTGVDKISNSLPMGRILHLPRMDRLLRLRDTGRQDRLLVMDKRRLRRGMARGRIMRRLLLRRDMQCRGGRSLCRREL